MTVPAPSRRFRIVFSVVGILCVSQVAAAQVSDFIFGDGFESGTLSAWSAVSTGGGDLSVSAAAALDSTSFGLSVVVNDTTGLYVEDDTPQDENRYRARFLFDPNDFDPGEAEGHLRTRIFIAFEENPSRRLMAVVLKRQSGAYSLMARARRDDGTQSDTGFFPITGASHSVEVDWRRSSGADANDGGLRFWIDGQLVSDLTGIDNSFSAVDFVRMGALSVKTGASGTLFFDELLSRRLFPPDATTPTTGGVVISEVMPNPNLTETEREWLELYNPTARTALVAGCELRDQSANVYSITSLAIRPGAYATLANGFTPGFTPDEVYSGVTLPNTSGALTVACGATEIDTVTWSTTTNGVSRQVDPIHLDAVSNDDESHWCPGITAFGLDGNLGTPGQPNVCP